MSEENNTPKRTRKEVDLSKLILVGQGTIEKAEGFQPSIWDAFKDSFPTPGSFLEWKKGGEDGLTSQQVSQIAARMRILHPGIHFHSGVNTTKNPETVFVRRREEGWIPSKEREKLKEQQSQKETDSNQDEEE
jgi:hypothetical protein